MLTADFQIFVLETSNARMQIVTIQISKIQKVLVVFIQ